MRDATHGPLWTGVAERPLLAGSLTLSMLGSCWFVAHVRMVLAGRRLDRGGPGIEFLRAEFAAGACRFLGTSIFIAGVLVFGWLDAVRAVVGDRILLDEFVALLPLVVVFVLSWWSFYPLERRMREAMLMRWIDEGRPVHPMPTRGTYTLNALRHQALLILVPILLVMTWAQLVSNAAMTLARPGPDPAWWVAHVPDWARQEPTLTWLATGGTLAGVLGVFIFMPLVLRVLWNTVPLGDGALRDRLVDLCRRHGVRVRAILVWRTQGSMINGAVIGIFGPLRYILLTDALLEQLPESQAEAVAAHEVGHVRRRHMPWLAVSIVGSLMLAGALGGWALELLAGPGTSQGWAAIGVSGGALAVALLAFGYVSRRFEWQADAFAAQHLSGMRTDGRDTPGELVVTAPAVDAMAGALESVARLNGMRPDRASWRHGSISSRQRRLRSLTGQPVDRLSIDRQVAGVKAISGAALFIGVVLLVLGVGA